MSTWKDVDDVCSALPDAVLGAAHEGSPAWYAGRHPFARYRRGGDLADDVADGQDLVQFWSGDLDLSSQLALRATTFPVVTTFTHRVSAWCVLERVDRRELAELLLDSYRIRGGARRAAGVDERAYFDAIT